MRHVIRNVIGDQVLAMRHVMHHVMRDVIDHVTQSWGYLIIVELRETIL
jgi:hypothetical protein